MILAPCLEDLFKLNDAQYYAKFFAGYPAKNNSKKLFFTRTTYENIILDYNNLIGAGSCHSVPSVKVEDIAAYIVCCDNGITKYKLHNLCYLTIAISSAMEDVNYLTRISLSTTGMSCDSLFYSIEPGAYWVSPEHIIDGSVNKLSARQRKLIEHIMHEYNNAMSSRQLEEFIIKCDGVWNLCRIVGASVDHGFIKQVYNKHIEEARVKYGYEKYEPRAQWMAV